MVLLLRTCQWGNDKAYNIPCIRHILMSRKWQMVLYIATTNIEFVSFQFRLRPFRHGWWAPSIALVQCKESIDGRFLDERKRNRKLWIIFTCCAGCNIVKLPHGRNIANVGSQCHGRDMLAMVIDVVMVRGVQLWLWGDKNRYCEWVRFYLSVRLSIVLIKSWIFRTDLMQIVEQSNRKSERSVLATHSDKYASSSTSTTNSLIEPLPYPKCHTPHACRCQHTQRTELCRAYGMPRHVMDVIVDLDTYSTHTHTNTPKRVMDAKESKHFRFMLSFSRRVHDSVGSFFFAWGFGQFAKTHEKMGKKSVSIEPLLRTIEGLLTIMCVCPFQNDTTGICCSLVSHICFFCFRIYHARTWQPNQTKLSHNQLFRSVKCMTIQKVRGALLNQLKTDFCGRRRFSAAGRRWWLKWRRIFYVFINEMK